MGRRGTATRRTGPAVTLPKLSIAAKLYVIFALIAATTLALSTVAVPNARHNAALADEFESANSGQPERRAHQRPHLRPIVGGATEDTRASARAIKAVADDLGAVVGRIHAQVDQFFERLSA